MITVSSIVDLLLVALVTVCAVSDLKTRKIPNALTYPALGLGFGLNAMNRGWAGLLDSFLAVCLVLVVFFPLYLTKKFGGGDVKLMAAVGAMMGLGFVAPAMIYSILLGALVAVVMVARQGSGWDLLRGSKVSIRTSTEDRRARSPVSLDSPFPFGVGICLGSTTQLILSRQGFLGLTL